MAAINDCHLLSECLPEIDSCRLRKDRDTNGYVSQFTLKGSLVKVRSLTSRLEQQLGVEFPNFLNKLRGLCEQE